jgi:hypothetical protein
MLDWIAERLLAIVNFVPAQFVDEGSAHFMLIRTTFALMLIVLIVGVMAMLRPFCSAIARYVSKVSDLIVHKQR